MTNETSRSLGSPIANVVVGGLRMLVNSLVAAVVAGLIVRQIGLNEYGLVAGLLAFAAAGVSISSAFVNANAMFLTRGDASKSYREASVMASSVIASIVIVTLASTALSLVIDIGLAGSLSSGHLGLLTALVAVAGGSACADALSAPYFVTERFAYRDVINGASRIFYLAVVAVSLPYLGVWAVAVAGAASAALRVGVFAVSGRQLLPYLRWSVRLVTGRALLIAIRTVGWISIAYLSAAVLTACLYAVVRLTYPQYMGEVAVALLLSGFVLQAMTVLGLVVSPAIIKSLAVGRQDLAVSAASEYILLTGLAVVAASVVVVAAGPSVVSVWLGVDLASNLVFVLMAALLVGWAGSLQVPASTYLIALDRARAYALLSVAELVLVIGAAAAALAALTLDGSFALQMVLLALLGSGAAVKSGIAAPWVARVPSPAKKPYWWIVAAGIAGFCILLALSRSQLPVPALVEGLLGCAPAAALLVRRLLSRSTQAELLNIA